MIAFKTSMKTCASLPWPGANVFEVVISDPSSTGSRCEAGAQPSSPSWSTNHQPWKKESFNHRVLSLSLVWGISEYLMAGYWLTKGV